MLDKRTIFGQNCVDDKAELAANSPYASAVVFSLSSFSVVESPEIWIEANSNIGSHEQRSAQIR